MSPLEQYFIAIGQIRCALRDPDAPIINLAIGLRRLHTFSKNNHADFYPLARHVVGNTEGSRIWLAKHGMTMTDKNIEDLVYMAKHPKIMLARKFILDRSLKRFMSHAYILLVK